MNIALGPLTLVALLAASAAVACTDRAAAPERGAEARPSAPSGAEEPPPGADIASPDAGETAAGSPGAGSSEGPSCGHVSFRLGVVPDGWAAEIQPGSGGGEGDHPALVGHFGAPGLAGTVEGARLGYADLVVGPPPFHQRKPRPLTVLGDETATFGAIHEGFSVEFVLGDCDYTLLGYGLTEKEMTGVATGLQPSD